MTILLIKTDQAEASLFLYEGTKLIRVLRWAADRQLAETIHLQIRDLLMLVDKTIEDLGGIGIYSGPGSFTGLRIGHSVANALAYGLGIPIVGTMGSQWNDQAVQLLENGEGQSDAMPFYGAPPRLTKPRK